MALMRSATLLALCAAVGLAACGSDEEGHASERQASGGSGGGSGSGGWPAGDSGTSTGGSGGTESLPCDAGFAFTPDPPQSGSDLGVAFTHAQPLTYIELRASGPNQPSISGGPITTSDPWTWTWTVRGLVPGVYGFEFWAGAPSQQIASCQRRVVDTGPAPDAGTGGNGGTGGGGTGGSGATGGSGGHCCNIVGTNLANPSPCGPSQADSPWQTLDNAGCSSTTGGCQRIWCPFEKCDAARYPNGCPQGTEACWIDDSYASYEDACRACCESYGACWDGNLSTCRHPGDCGTSIWKCPWEP